MVAVLLLTGGCGGDQQEQGFEQTGWIGVQHFESRTFRAKDASLVAREEGLIDGQRGDAIVRSFDPGGALVAESAVVGDVVVARLASQRDWYVTKAETYAPVQSDIAESSLQRSANWGDERALNTKESPLGWDLGSYDHAAELKVPGETIAGAATRAHATVEGAIGAQLPEVDTRSKVVWRRWWRKGRLVAEEYRIAAIDPEQPKRRAEIVQSIVFVPGDENPGGVLANALALGWEETVWAVRDAYEELFDREPKRRAISLSHRPTWPSIRATTATSCTRRSTGPRFPAMLVPPPPRRTPQLSRADAPTVAGRAMALSGTYPPTPAAGTTTGAVTPRQSLATSPRGLGLQGVAIAESIAILIFLRTVEPAWEALGKAIAEKVKCAAQAIATGTPCGQDQQQDADDEEEKKKHEIYDTWRRQRQEDYEKSIEGIPAPPEPRPESDCLDAEDKEVLLDDWDEQLHHIATDKRDDHWKPEDERITSRFRNFLEQQFGKNAPDLDDDWNTMYVWHGTDCPNGGHPRQYHDWVYRNMELIAAEANGDVERFKQLWRRVIADIYRDPSILSCNYWCEER